MEKLRIHVCDAAVHVTQLGKLTSGMVGMTASFSFSPEWSGLLKTAVFVGTAASKDKILTGSTVEIPPECLANPGSLYVGVYGHLEDGTIVIPTVMSDRIGIDTGTRPSGDTQSGFTPDKWMQMLAMIGDISHLTTEAKSSLVGAINELAARSGGEVDPVEVQRLVQEYLAAHPPAGGVSPTVTVAAINGGHRVTVTDVNGVNTFDIMDGNVGPRGPEGPRGPAGDDYGLTDADKTEIAQMAAGIVDTALLDIIGTGEVTA